MQHRFRGARHFVAVLLVGLLEACGEPGGPAKRNPVPVLESLEPNQIVLHSFGRQLRLVGAGFTSSSRVNWRGGEHTPTFESSSALSVQLELIDVAYEGLLDISVTNPGPGGGVSDTIVLPVGLPKPVVTSVSPATLVAGASATLTINGSGFVSESVVAVNGVAFSVTPTSPEQIIITVADTVLSTGGVVRLVVTNRGPAGGTSSPIDIPIVVPVPTISSLQLPFVVVGTATSVPVFGTGFVRSSVVYVNGAPHQTVYHSGTLLTVPLAGSEITDEGVVSFQVITPAPGGGQSNVGTLTARYLQPALSSVLPGTVVAGAGAFTAWITGDYFGSVAMVYVNGQPRATQYVSPTVLRFGLLASDVAAAGEPVVEVVQGSQRSWQQTFSVVAPPEPGKPLYMGVTNAALTWDRYRNTFYASVHETAPEPFARSVMRVDPTGVLGDPIRLDGVPGRSVITDDGRYLYVIVSDAPKVVRIDLNTFAKDLEIPLGIGPFGPRIATDLEILPGQPHAIVVSRRSGVYHDGIAVFDDAVMRPATSAASHRGDRLTGSGNATTLYAYDSDLGTDELQRLAVSASGIVRETSVSGLIGVPQADIEYEAGRIYSTSGAVIDAATLTRVGTIAAQGAVRPDAATGHVFFAPLQEFRIYDIATLSLEQTLFSGCCGSYPAQLIRWGSDGLAIGGVNVVVLIRSPLIGP